MLLLIVSITVNKIHWRWLLNAMIANNIFRHTYNVTMLLCVVLQFLPRAVLSSLSRPALYVRYMLSPVRLSSVCNRNARAPYSTGWNFSAIFLHRWVLWPSTDIYGKFYGDPPGWTSPSASRELNARGVAKHRFLAYWRLYLGNGARYEVS